MRRTKRSRRREEAKLSLKTTILRQMISEILVAARKKKKIPLEKARKKKQKLKSAVDRRGLLHQIII